MAEEVLLTHTLSCLLTSTHSHISSTHTDTQSLYQSAWAGLCHRNNQPQISTLHGIRGLFFPCSHSVSSRAGGKALLLPIFPPPPGRWRGLSLPVAITEEKETEDHALVLGAPPEKNTWHFHILLSRASHTAMRDVTEAWGWAGKISA